MNDILRDAAERLRAAGIESPRAEARLLWERARENSGAFTAILQRRFRHEPIAYITGHKEFWGLELEVGPGVLIPRPETETLIEEALRELRGRNGEYRFLDLGTGSGCLLIALLEEFFNAKGTGIDSSEAALQWARRNVAQHGLESRCALVHAGWEAAEGKFDLIVSNPPYIPSPDLAELPPDIQDYEPATAMDGGADGVSAYRTLAPLLKAHLHPNGVGLLEIGAGQSPMVGEIMRAAGLSVVRVAPDMAGIPRCVVVKPG